MELPCIRITFARQRNTQSGPGCQFGVVGCHPLIDALFTAQVEPSFLAHHHERLGDTKIGRVAQLFLQFASGLFIQNFETGRRVRQMVLALQECPESLQLADDLICLVSRSRYFAREEIEEDLTQIIRSYSWWGDAEIVHPEVRHHTGPARLNPLAQKLLSFG